MARKFLAASLMIGTAILCFVFRRTSAHEYASAASKIGVAQGAGSPSAANAELEEAVNSMLRSDNQLRKATLKVEADVTKNEVTLFGTVESEAIRAKAVELTKTAHVGVVVNDRIAVRPDRQSDGE
jgi:osmotically-inducible protein OsmY